MRTNGLQGSVKRAVSLGGNLDIKVDAIFRKMQVVYPLIFGLQRKYALDLALMTLVL